MLPFHKRNSRSDEVEDLKSEDIDVIAIARPGLRVPTPLPPPASLRPLPVPVPPPSVRPPPASVRPPSSRPRVMDSLTDEVTTLMPAKALSLPPPPRSMRPNAYLDERGPRSGFVPAPPSSARQLGTLPAQTLSPRPINFAAPSVPPPPAVPFVPVAPHSVAPVSYGVAGRGSEPRFDPPGTVITTRTKLLTGRPTLSWGAALVALGVFAGLVTAVLARGDGDSLVNATAAFVDPAHAAAAAPAAPVLAAAAPMAPAPMAPAPMIAQPAAAPVVAPVVQPVAQPAAAPEKAAPAPMAYSQPTEKKAEKPVAEKAAPAPEKVATTEKSEKKAAVAAPAPKPVAVASHPAPAARPTPVAAAPKEKPAKHPKDDLASAKEAKALADAQLEASLR